MQAALGQWRNRHRRERTGGELVKNMVLGDSFRHGSSSIWCIPDLKEVQEAREEDGRK